MKDLAIHTTSIPGLWIVDLPVHADERGWFKENYQQAKLEALGLPKFTIVQNNISFNQEVGVTRGFHAEPWEKFISVGSGSVFGAYIDLRQGPTFGAVETVTITPEVGVFVERGIANAYQTLGPNAVYSYLVNAHWSNDIRYPAVQLFDPALNVQWPIPQEQAIVSPKDRENPLLANVTPIVSEEQA